MPRWLCDSTACYIKCIGCSARYCCDNRIHDWSADDDQCETVSCLFDSEPFVLYDASRDESSTNEKEWENHEAIFNFFLHGRRCFSIKWYINNRSIAPPPEDCDNEKTSEDMHETNSRITRTSCDKLGEFYEEGVHREEEKSMYWLYAE